MRYRAGLVGILGGLLGVILTGAPPVSFGVARQPGRTAATWPEAGEWTVTEVGQHAYRLRWRSAQPLPMTADRPVIVSGDEPAGFTVALPDGHTVQTIVRTANPPDPAGFDVLLSGDRLDETGRDNRSGRAPAAAPDRAALPDDPGKPGPFAVVTSEYELAALPLPGYPQPLEMVGHVVEPALGEPTGPRPLVLFLHGRHSVCYDPADPDSWQDDWPCRPPFAEIPSHLGYDYVQRLLASQGYATVSIRANGINAQDGGVADAGADARARLVQAHLDHWVTIADDHGVDLSRTVLVGHSRGGEGVNRASLQIPLTAPYRIVGQVLIAPTDFAVQAAPYVPTVTILPYCDGDVSDLQGQRFTDVARDVSAGDTSLKSSLLVMGANHNYFNSEWTPETAVAPAWDDWWGNPRRACGTDTPGRLTAAEQREVGAAYISGAVRLFADDAEEFLPMFDGSAVSVASVGFADVRSHLIGAGREMRRPGLDAGLSLADGAETQLCRGVSTTPGQHRMCGRQVSSGQTPHWLGTYPRTPTRPAFEMAWSAAGQRGGLALDRPLDLTSRLLDLRTVVDPDQGAVDLRVRLHDDTGAADVLVPVGGGRLVPLQRGPMLSRRWAQTLRVDPSTATGLDLSRVTGIDLVAVNPVGRVWVLDVAAVPSTLAAVPSRRVPTVSLGNVKVVEGDPPGAVTLRLPYTIDGQVTRRTRLQVWVAPSPAQVDRGSFAVEIAAGQTHGVIPIDYRPDQRYQPRPRRIQVFAWAGREVMTDDYQGVATILEDDPAPTVTLRPTQPRFDEGEPVVFVARFSPAMATSSHVRFRFVSPGGADEIQLGDLARWWLVGSGVADLPATTPLHDAGVVRTVGLRPGQRSVAFRLPVRDDAVPEASEAVALRARLGQRSATASARISRSD